MSRLTKRQRQVVQVIREFIETHGYPPTYRDLMALLGVRSTNAIACHLNVLQRKGHLQVDCMRSRGIRLTATVKVPARVSAARTVLHSGDAASIGCGQ
jgi:repressor LexA